MKKRIAIVIVAATLAACASRSPDHATPQGPAAARASQASEPIASQESATTSIDDYKREVAEQISRLNQRRVYGGRPQALLRSVVVLRYTVDAHGRLLRSEVLRSNHDRETETTALASLRNSAPFPQPARRLLRRGRVDISETWLFNNDGRFQLRSIARAQMDH